MSGSSSIDRSAVGNRSPAEVEAASALARDQADRRDVAAAADNVKVRLSGKVASVPAVRVLPNGVTVVRFDMTAGRPDPAQVFVRFPTSASAKLANVFADAVTRQAADGATSGGRGDVDVTVAGRWRKGNVVESGKPSYWFEGVEAAVGKDVRLPLLDGVAAPVPVPAVSAGGPAVSAGSMLDDGSVRLGGGKVLAIIGTAGRKNKHGVEGPSDMDRVSGPLYDVMVDSARQVVKSTGAAALVSGGAAWADHVAVSLALDGTIDPRRLTLFLPAELGPKGFKEDPSLGRLDAGRTANYYHGVFADKTGRDPIAELHEVIRRGAVVDADHKGFKQRNTEVARIADGVLAFTFGSGPAWMPVVAAARDHASSGVKDGGTADTWDKSRAPVKIHVTLAPVAGNSVDRSRTVPAPVVAASARESQAPLQPASPAIPDKMRVVNVRDYPNNTLPPDVLYVGRGKGGVPGDLGNPFVVGRDGTASETVAKFRPYFRQKLADPAFEAKVMAATRGKTAVACFCANASGNFACHGQVISEEVAVRRARERGSDLSPAVVGVAAPASFREPFPAAPSTLGRFSPMAGASQAAFDYALREGVAVDRAEQRLRASEAAAAAPKPPQDRDVLGFGGSNRIFSNMAGAKVLWGDALTPEREWPNVEVPYHLARTNDVAVRDRLMKAADAGFRASADRGESDTLAAEVAGKFVKKAWKEVGPGEADVERKEQIMRALVYDKFGRDQGASKALASTGNGRIVEQNAWGDVYWGVAERDMPQRGIKAGDGQNKLGEITQDARTILGRDGPDALVAEAARIRERIFLPMGMDRQAAAGVVAPVAESVREASLPILDRAFLRGQPDVQAGPGSVISGSGDMFLSGAEAIVNTVNCVGAMGAGIAERVRDGFPGPYKAYRADVGIGLACDGTPDPSMGPRKEQRAAACCQPGETCGAHKVRPGEVIVRPTGQDSPKYIIDFPSKRHWNEKSRLSDVEAGLPALADAIRRHGIKSVAVPPIGCGNGGLDWAVVGPKVRGALGSLDGVDVRIFDGIGAAIPPLAKSVPAAPSRRPVGDPAAAAVDPKALESSLRAAKPHTSKDPDAFMLVLSKEQVDGMTADALGRVAAVALPLRKADASRRLTGDFLSITVGYGDVARDLATSGPDKASRFLADLPQAALSSAANARASSAAFAKSKISQTERV